MIRLQGKVKAGVIVLDEPLDVPDGTPVTVEMASRDWLLRFAGLWHADPDVIQAVSDSYASRTSSPGRSL